VKKNISIVSFIAMSMMSLHAMELIDLTQLPLIDDYGSLTEDTFDIIQQQKQTFSNPVFINPAGAYLDAVQSSLKLDQLHKSFCSLSERSKREVMRTMSLQLLHLHAVALCLPPEIVKDHIILSLLDGNTDAAEQFYNVPFVQAFDLYHEIKEGLSDDTQSIGDLYAQSKQIRDLVLKLHKKPWYYSQPIINFEDNEEIGLLPDDIKSRYLGGKKILVLKEGKRNSVTPKEVCIGALISSGIGMVLFGGSSAVFAIVGACSTTGAKLACSSMVLGVTAGASGGVSSLFFVFMLCAGCESLRRHAQEITI